MEKQLELFIQLANLFDEHKYKLYLVGGTVRDYLLRLPLSDMDLVTDATPEEMQTFLSNFKIDMTFSKYGSIVLTYEGEKFDIVTMRKEKKYQDFRHPGEVKFVKKLNIDVKRRDFTINALYMDKDFNVIDYVDGLKDLYLGKITIVGPMNKKIKEDPLRILRALRFALTYNFIIDDNLKKAIFKNIGLIDKLSKNKIEQEIRKIKCSDTAKVEELFTQFGIHYLLEVIK